MSAYELNDTNVARLCEWYAEVDIPLPMSVRETLNRLLEQVPVPVPTGLGAVVRTDKGIFVRADRVIRDDQHTWYRPSGMTEERPFIWYTDHEIGRVLNVLSPGVPDGVVAPNLDA